MALKNRNNLSNNDIHKPAGRRSRKTGFSPEMIGHILEFMDAVLPLPPHLERKLRRQLLIEFLPDFERVAASKRFNKQTEEVKERIKFVLQYGSLVTMEDKFGKKASSPFLPIIFTLKSTGEVMTFLKKIRTCGTMHELKSTIKQKAA